MKYQLSEQFRRKYKKQNVRIKNAIDKTLKKFSKNHLDPELNNHSLKNKFQGMRSIDITDDWRALYREERERIIFFEIGTHNQLYK